MSHKFSERDRNIVVKRLASITGRALVPAIPGKRKVLKDDLDNYYVVLGGRSWHGIERESCDFIAAHANASKLVIAIKSCEAMTVYMGDFAPFLASRARMNLEGASEQYQVHVEERWDRLVVKGIPSDSLPDYSLARVDVVEYGDRPDSRAAYATAEASIVGALEKLAT